ncbi:MAG: sigma-54 dependent transcriptional regulator [Planctomycetota bacterium]|nr:sigma-54 dependent transcriptional regulator [Planctomycetota bacterium]
MARILVVEDEASLRSSIRRSLELDGHAGAEAECLRDAFELLSKDDYDAVITDLNLVGESGLDLIKRLRSEGFGGLLVVVTAYGTVEGAVEAVRAGADEFIQKPLRLDELSLVIARGLEHRRVKGQLDLHRRIQRVSGELGEALGTSEPWTRTLALGRRFAALPLPTGSTTGELPTILLMGETGSGKGVLARHIHESSAPGKQTPFVHVNCAALPASLIESELFGHEQGAFTDAKAARPGLFELAEGGTIFLDEVGEMALDMQAKLLLVVERGIFRRIGGTRERRVRARIVAATNQDLEERAVSGSFRSDLLFRLNALTIQIPPLRERGDDAVLIAEAALARAAQQFGRPGLQLSESAREAIRAHTWPGNTRELLNAVRRAVILCDEQHIGSEHLGIRATGVLRHAAMPSAPARSGMGPVLNGVGGVATVPAVGGDVGSGAAHAIDFSQGPVTFEAMERSLITAAIRHAHGNVSLAAKLIGLNRGALRYRIERLGLEPQVREISER